ncbi:MAG: imidazoleglycerol-phosphate dehydratase HisB [Thermomicrobium sp.]|nr:imidazoleglycerol-phosphate dehydratase HisB [Thermomicrobium sp.]MCS7246454.1 imidazoleglycerol-phosphate dehydratase HisB [Thermomicrobium sp.]MDW7982832.1 imidazoleglycerol-phosphate dehydratase HisB [Thermomicrobium sp.]
MSQQRCATIERSTAETTVFVHLSLDGTGQASIETGVGALDHFLTLFARHGRFDLTVRARGDLHVDAHHTVEDVAICLGQAVRRALGDWRGLQRMADAAVPMDEALAHIAIDLSGRGGFVHRAPFPSGAVGQLDCDLVRHLLETFAREARITIHVVTLYGMNTHHQMEALFKALARALDMATTIDVRIAGSVPSTKEHLEVDG